MEGYTGSVLKNTDLSVDSVAANKHYLFTIMMIPRHPGLFRGLEVRNIQRTTQDSQSPHLQDVISPLRRKCYIHVTLQARPGRRSSTIIVCPYYCNSQKQSEKSCVRLFNIEKTLGIVVKDCLTLKKHRKTSENDG